MGHKKSLKKVLEAIVIFAAFCGLVFIGFMGIRGASSSDESRVLQGEELSEEQVFELNSLGLASSQTEVEEQLQDTDFETLDSNLNANSENFEEASRIISNALLGCRANQDIGCANRYLERAQDLSLPEAELAGYFVRYEIFLAKGDLDAADEELELINIFASENGLEELIQGGEL